MDTCIPHFPTAIFFATEGISIIERAESLLIAISRLLMLAGFLIGGPILLYYHATSQASRVPRFLYRIGNMLVSMGCIGFLNLLSFISPIRESHIAIRLLLGVLWLCSLSAFIWNANKLDREIKC